MSRLILPEFATDGTNEEEPSEGKKATGWTDGEEPAAEYLNWLSRVTYEAVASMTGAGQALAAQYHSTLGQFYTPASTTIDARFVAVDDDVIMAALLRDSTETVFVRSTDGGVTFSTTYGPITETPPTRGGVSPGQYAVTVLSASVWWYSPYPYTTWTKVSSATFNTTAGAVNGVASLGGAASFILGVANSGTNTPYLYYTDAYTVPTVAGDWTELDLSSVQALNILSGGVATDGALVAVAGGDGADGYVLYTTGDVGTVAGDWSSVLVSGNDLYDIVYSGSYFVAVDSAGDIYTSTDCVTWTQTSTTSANVARLVTDPETGWVLAHTATGGGTRDLYVSKDGGLTFTLVLAGASNSMEITNAAAVTTARYGYSSFGRYFCGSDGATIAAFRRSF